MCTLLRKGWAKRETEVHLRRSTDSHGNAFGEKGGVVGNVGDGVPGSTISTSELEYKVQTASPAVFSYVSAITRDVRTSNLGRGRLESYQEFNSFSSIRDLGKNLEAVPSTEAR